MKITYVATYPPKACGIGTFTHNLASAVTSNEKEGKLSKSFRVVAMSEPEDQINYPEEVDFCVDRNRLSDYIDAANRINNSDAEIVVLQHEYGIFGGQDGSYILSFIDELDKPVVATFHTVLKTPSRGQELVMRSIAAKVSRIIVMTRMAKQFLEEIYKIPKDKIAIIEHGVPICETESREALRQKLDFQDKRILLTFGLLGRGKGIETIINALPEIVEKYPETRYIVLGKTHPAIVRQCGEEYRDYLKSLAEQKGVADNVIFLDQFTAEQELWEYLRACDIYVTPYLSEAQITSGTLSYAIGAGAAVVSTPYWHAQELLEDGRGRLFDFRNSDQLSNIVLELFGNEADLFELRRRAGAYGHHLKWNLIGRQYLNLFKQVVREKAIFFDEKFELDATPPPISFKHLSTMTDSTGILQHAKYSFPNRHEGYCLDDNARALIAVLMWRKKHASSWHDQAAHTYMSYIYHCQREDGLFRNFMSYDRQFLEEIGSEDSFGRAVWAMGYSLAFPLNGDFYSMAKEIFERTLVHVPKLGSLRSIAYCMLGISYYLKRHSNDENMLNLLHTLSSKLCERYHASSTEGWEWFEESLTYCNGILPLALFHCLEHIPDEAVQQVALSSTRFLERHTLTAGYCQPIGCRNFYVKGGQRSIFDQQPVDVMIKVLLFLQASKVTGQKSFIKKALLCDGWFYGKNDLRMSIYDAETGGCCDGLTQYGLNQNQGAESTLSCLISRMAVEEVMAARKPSNGEQAKQPIMKYSNGTTTKAKEVWLQENIPHATI